MKNVAKLCLHLSLLIAAAAFAAETQPNFTGTWKLNVAKSEMGTSAVTELVADVDHKDPVFKYTAKGMASGQAFEVTETINTDGTRLRTRKAQPSKPTGKVRRWLQRPPELTGARSTLLG